MNKISADQLARGLACIFASRRLVRSRTIRKANGCNTHWLIVPGSWDGQRSMSSMRIWGVRRVAFIAPASSVCWVQFARARSGPSSALRHRASRAPAAWHTLLEFCGVVGVLLIDANGIYDPRQINDRLVLGMKGTISEMEVATFRQRA